MNLGRPHQLHVNFCSLALLTHRSSLAWENSQTYASHHQLVSPWDYTWGTTTDVTAQNLVVFQIGWSKLPSQQWPIRSTTQIRVVTHHHCGISPVVPLKPRVVQYSTNRTIGINGPSVWRIVSVCVYWTCVFGKGFRCEKSSFEFEDVYVMSGLRVSSWQHELQPALDASEVLYRSESKELITIPSRVVNFWNHRRSGSVWVLLFRCTDVS